MDRETLLACVDDLGSCGVKFNGDFIDTDGTEWEIADVESAVAELEGELSRLRKVLAWAKTAPLAAG